MTIYHRFAVFLLPGLLLMPFQTHAFGESYSFGIGVGQSSFELKETNIIASYPNLTNNSSFSDKSTTLLLSGSVRLDEFLSLDLEYLEQGDVKAKESSVESKLFDVSTLTFAVALNQAIGENINAYARLGVHMWDATTGSNFDSLDSSVEITYGLGLDINIYGGKERMMRLQWDHYEYDGVYLDSSDVFGVSLRFVFGE